MTVSAECTEIRRYKWVYFYACAFLGFLCWCLLAATITGANTPLNSSLPDESVAVLANRRSMYRASTVFDAPAYQVSTGNGLQQRTASSWNFTTYFGMSAMGSYYTAEFGKASFTVFAYTQYMPCEWKNDTQSTVVYVAQGGNDGRRTRRLDSTFNAIDDLHRFDPCTAHIAEACEIEYRGAYGHLVAAFVFSMLAIVLQVIRAWRRCSMDNHRIFFSTCLAWLLVCSLSAAGAGNFYQRCVLPTASYLKELSFDALDADLTITYGPLTNCAIAASAFAGTCLVVNATLYYISPNDTRLSILSRPSAAPEKRVTIGAVIAEPAAIHGGERSVGEDMNHGDIYANTGRT